MADWNSRFESEMKRAEQARQAGNEGMARVCARRAAGIIIDEFLHRQGMAPGSRSAYDNLRHFYALPDISDELREIAGHFLVRITPEHTLPVRADLLAEARMLQAQLIDE